MSKQHQYYIISVVLTTGEAISYQAAPNKTNQLDGNTVTKCKEAPRLTEPQVLHNSCNNLIKYLLEPWQANGGRGGICTLNTAALYLAGEMELFPEMHLRDDILSLLE